MGGWIRILGVGSLRKFAFLRRLTVFFDCNRVGFTRQESSPLRLSQQVGLGYLVAIDREL
jgi:hypothetical protein